MTGNDFIKRFSLFFATLLVAAAAAEPRLLTATITISETPCNQGLLRRP